MLDPNKLRMMRVKRGYSQDQVARASEIMRPMISKMETPSFPVDPRLSTMERLCRALNCTIADITSDGTVEDRKNVVMEEVEREGAAPRSRRKAPVEPSAAEVMGTARDQT